MFHPLREGGKLGAFNYKQINPFAKYGFIPLNSLPHFGYLTASPRSARRSSSLREGGDVRVNAEILNVYISPSGGCGRDGGGGVFARDREMEICSLSPGRELYARVDPFVQIAATNFKKNMSSPSSQLSSPPRRIPSFRRTLMRKISKRRSSSSLADPLNRQKRHRMPPRYSRAEGFDPLPNDEGTSRLPSTWVKTNP